MTLGQLTGATGPFGTLGYTYDDSGNRLGESRASVPTTAAGRSFIYDQLGQLIAVSASGGAALAEYSYNAQGQRVKKEPAQGETKGFIYDFEGNLLCEIDSTGAIGREYLYRGSSRVGFVEDGNLYYFHNDTTGNPILVTDVDNMAVWEGIYEPFGNAVVDSQSTVENNLRFQGQYFDEETGFHYNMHRYYDPRTGRYITPDPIGLAGGINLYAYAGNDPVNGVDPLGLLVFGTFNVATGLLTVTDADTGQTKMINAESGGKPFGDPIPVGQYDILDHPKTDFLRLEALDVQYGNDRDDQTGRGEFRLHKPGNTIGCIAAKDNWQEMRDLIRGAMATLSEVDSKWINPFSPDKEMVRRFGVMTVINTTNSVLFNRCM